MSLFTFFIPKSVASDIRLIREALERAYPKPEPNAPAPAIEIDYYNEEEALKQEMKERLIKLGAIAREDEEEPSTLPE